MPGELQRPRRLRDEPVRPAARPARGDRRRAAGLGTGGSSSGIGTAASFWAANVGTETSGSILSPANQNMLVGIKPTVGRVSRHGVIPDHRRPGHAGADGADGRRRGHHARRAGGRAAGPERRGDQDLRAAARARLHEIPQCRGPQGRADRHPARLVLRPGHAARCHAAARRAERRAGEGDGRGHRHPEAAGRGHRGPGGHPERHDDRGEGQLPALVHVRRPRQREGQGRRLLGGLQVRHEARLQRVARVARPRGAGEDAHRAAAVERRASAGRGDQVRPGAARHLR